MPGRPSPRPLPALFSLLLAGAAVASPALANQPNVAAAPAVPAPEPAEALEPPPDLNQLLRDVGDPDFAARSEASRLLSADTRLTLADIETLLVRPALSSEQHARLIAAARDRFVRSPRAALGVQFANAGMGPVVIGKTFERFPAASVLRQGDEILSVDGRSVNPGWDNIRPLIISREPGESLRLEIIRGGEHLFVDAPLGRFSDLPAQRDLTPNDLIRAWNARSLRYPAPPTQPVIETPPNTVWMTRSKNAIDLEWDRRFESDTPRGGVVAGGRSPGPLITAEGEARLGEGPWNGGVRPGNGFVPAIRPGNQIARAAQEAANAARTQLLRLLDQRGQLQGQIGNTEAELGGPGLTDARRRDLQVRMLNLQNQIAIVDRQIDSARARIADPRRAMP